MIKKRGVVSFYLLTMITGGLYFWWRIHVLARDVNVMCKGDGKKTGGFLVFWELSRSLFIIGCGYINLGTGYAVMLTSIH